MLWMRCGTRPGDNGFLRGLCNEFVLAGIARSAFFRVRRRISFRGSVLRHLMQSERVFGSCLKCLSVSCTVCFSSWWLPLSLDCVAGAILCDPFGHLCSHKTLPCTRTIFTAGRICICCGVYECAGDIAWGTRKAPTLSMLFGAPVMYANPHLLEMGITESLVPFFVDRSEAKRTKILFLPCREKCEIIPGDSQISRDIIRVSQQDGKGFCVTLILLETNGVRMWSSFPRKIIFCRIKGPKRNLEVLIRHLDKGQTLTRMGAAVPPNLETGLQIVWGLPVEEQHELRCLACDKFNAKKIRCGKRKPPLFQLPVGGCVRRTESRTSFKLSRGVSTPHVSRLLMPSPLTERLFLGPLTTDLGWNSYAMFSVSIGGCGASFIGCKVIGMMRRWPSSVKASLVSIILGQLRSCTRSENCDCSGVMIGDADASHLCWGCQVHVKPSTYQFFGHAFVLRKRLF